MQFGLKIIFQSKNDNVLGSFYHGIRRSIFVVDHKIECDDSLTRVQISPSPGVSPAVDFNVFHDAVLALTDATQRIVGQRTVFYSIQEVKSDSRQGLLLVSGARACVKREVFLCGVYVLLGCGRSSNVLFSNALTVFVTVKVKALYEASKTMG